MAIYLTVRIVLLNFARSAITAVVGIFLIYVAILNLVRARKMLQSLKQIVPLLVVVWQFCLV